MTNKKKPKFLRRDWYKKSKLGRKRKNKRVWRKPKGRHTKTRLKHKGKSKQPSIGYGRDWTERGRIQGKKPIIINNAKELKELRGMNDLAIFVAKNVGILKKMNIAEKAIELKMTLSNLNAEQFLEKIKQAKEKKRDEQKKKEAEKKKKEIKEEKKEEKNEEEKAEDKKEEEKKDKQKIIEKEIPKVKQEAIKPKKAIKAPMMRKALEK